VNANKINTDNFKLADEMLLGDSKTITIGSNDDIRFKINFEKE
jgi:hypothetical protein